METCERCNGWFDPRTEGVNQAGLFSEADDQKLCGPCYDEREKQAREAEAARHESEAKEA